MTEDRQTIDERRLGDLIVDLGSADLSPGAGAAAAIALALAAACASKAVAITQKHGVANEALSRARAELATLGRQALLGADEDARDFEAFSHSKQPSAASELVHAGEKLTHLGERLLEILSDLDAHIHPVVAGDIAAARALCNAFMTIQQKNLAENRRAADAAR